MIGLQTLLKICNDQAGLFRIVAVGGTASLRRIVGFSGTVSWDCALSDERIGGSTEC